MADPIDHELADARAQLVSKLFGLIDNLTVRAEALDVATLDQAADLVALMTAPVDDIEVAVRKLDNLLRVKGDPEGGATVSPLRRRARS